MAKQFGQLAHHFSNPEKVIGWLASRKYNGWSIIWDGGLTTGMMATDVPWYYRGKDKPVKSTGLWSLGRGNKPKVIHAPDYFIDSLPKGIPVHGELWYNDRLDVVKRTCGHKQYPKPMWRNIKFIAFHIKPFHLWEHDGLLPETETPATLSGSLDLLRQYENKTFMTVATTKMETVQDVNDMIQRAVDNQWEGIMFGNPLGAYECARSWNNLKWKQEYETEAVVHGYENGQTGKTIGKVGSLQCSLVWDDKITSIYGGLKNHIGEEVVFNVSGLTDAEREWDHCKAKFPTGRNIKIKYSGVSRDGVPQSPNIYRGM